MKIVLLSIALVMMLSGIVLSLMSRKYKSELARSIPWYNFKFWCNPWRLPDIYTEKGVRMHSLSLSLIMSGVALVVVVKGLPSLF